VSLRVEHGLPEALRADAARLYWQAFGSKLGAVLGPDARALRFLERVIRLDQVIVARDGDELLGLAGFKTPEGSFAGGTAADMRAIYGRIGAFWRMALIGLLSRDIDNERFLLDGICVAPHMRSQGIGAALMEEIAEEGARRGYTAVRLDVVDGNFRARALYERLGFRAVKQQRLGPLRHVFGFSVATTMVRDLP
jgi:ribosomal protein S18 acetylase RimI-like enzyme